MTQSAHIVIDQRVAIEMATVDFATLEAVRQEFEHPNPHRAALMRMGVPHWGEPAIITTWREEDENGDETPIKSRVRWLTVPRGARERVLEMLVEHGYELMVDDERTFGDTDLHGRIPKHKLTLRFDQQKVVEKVLGKETCLVRAPTGSGKTTCALALVSQVNLPALVIVNNAGLFDQWQERAKKELGIKAGVIRGPKRDIRPLTIAMQATLAKQGVTKELAETFGLVICDEVQLFAAKTFFQVVDPFAAKFRVGFSADQKRKDGKEFLIHDLFGEVAVEVSREELEDAGHVLDVVIDVVPTNFEADWYGIPDAGKVLDVDRLLKEMAEDEERNGLILEHACYDVLRGEQVLVMSHRREHCQKLAAGLVGNNVRTGFMIGGEDYRKEYVRTRAALLKGEISAAVGTYQAIGQGIDLPRISSVVAGTPIASNRQFVQQVRGRVSRTAPGKTGARMVYLWDKNVFGWKHLQNLCAWNRRVRVLVAGEWIDARGYVDKMGPRRQVRHKLD